MITFTKIPATWMIYIPSDNDNPAIWVNLAQVRYVERLKEELVVIYFDGTLGQASVVCLSGDRARIFLEELAKSPGLHYE